MQNSNFSRFAQVNLVPSFQVENLWNLTKILLKELP